MDVLGSGTNGNIQKIAASKTTLGIFYVVGAITITYLNGVSTSATTNFAKWTGSAWQILSFSPVTSITRIDVDASENIYIINGTDISSYNGTSWSNLTKNNSGGTAVISGTISDIFVDASNILWAVGTFFLGVLFESNWILDFDWNSRIYTYTCAWSRRSYLCHRTNWFRQL